LQSNRASNAPSASMSLLPEYTITWHLARVDELFEEIPPAAPRSPEQEEQKAAQIAIQSHLRTIAALISVLCEDRLPGRSGLPKFPFGRHRIFWQPLIERFLTSAKELQQLVLPNYKPVSVGDFQPAFTRDSLFETLTEREKDVLTRVLTGDANKMIAYKMNIREATVKAHVSSLLRKFAVPSRTRLIALFRESE
ncbi:MAG: LuxR C-terminal-related transcriptional regulator, partial [Alphaproteobacteria bacterium]|nr:LuxR C-terminal-related transcriptional regulator [Alphaproteobacteria bacterium]